MNLNEEDIYNKLESFRHKNGYSQGKMAEFMGLSNRQAYLNMAKNRTMKMIYFINLVNNTNIDISDFFGLENKYNLPNSIPRNSDDPGITTYSCQDCISKQKEIDALHTALEAKEELLDIYRSKKTNCG